MRWYQQKSKYLVLIKLILRQTFYLMLHLSILLQHTENIFYFCSLWHNAFLVLMRVSARKAIIRRIEGTTFSTISTWLIIQTIDSQVTMNRYHKRVSSASKAIIRRIEGTAFYFTLLFMIAISNWYSKHRQFCYDKWASLTEVARWRAFYARTCSDLRTKQSSRTWA